MDGGVLAAQTGGEGGGLRWRRVAAVGALELDTLVGDVI